MQSEKETGLTVFHLVQPVEGGVARVVTDLARAQTEGGLRVIVACPPGGELAHAAARAGAKVLAWPASRAPGATLAAETRRVRRLVRHVQPEIIHAHSAKAGLAGRLAVRGTIPTVFQPHAWSFDAVSGATSTLALRWERYGARWANRVLCVSEAERRAGEIAGIHARWSVIRNGVDLRHFRPGGCEERSAARAVLPLLSQSTPQGPLVVCVGRLCRQKGQDVLLRAWPEVTAVTPTARLVLVGDGPDRAQLQATAPSGVLFAGSTQDIRPWLQAADLVVLPSRWEGMALAPLEAMACGRPVVVTDVSGARESLPPGQAAQCLVPPENPTALAKALGGLLTEPGALEAGGRLAHEHARTAFDVRRTTAEVTGLYQELLGRSRPLNQERISR
ncbi:glycosyltransferase family 4 protein [Streptomyces sp. NPDC006879]|uniref:glycosyltransferase family 4 protein n=1 Tax=Streptomyces sp. NPDC006879 TaxID=3364767 RepID=UPI003690CB0D